MCITNYVPMQEHDEELDNLGVMENLEIIADLNNQNIDLTLRRQQRDKVVRYLFNRNDA